MIIDKTYIIERFGQFFIPCMDAQAQIDAQFEGFYRRKSGLPKWTRPLLHPRSPLHTMWKGAYVLRRYWHSARSRRSLTHALACDFITYCFQNNAYRLDTADFADANDLSQIVAYIDNRLRSALGMPLVQATDPQDGFTAFERKIQKRHGLWLLPLDGKLWKLPACPEAYGAFVHYGLDLLPERVAAYIAGKDFVDCGAWVGDSAIYFLKYRPRKVYAFEPLPVNYDLLLKSIHLNALQEVVPLRKGLGDAPGTAAMTDLAGGSRIVGDPPQESDTYPIDISTIDRECRQMNVGLIKMDVEGFEYNVVRGALETIKHDRPVMLLSIYHTGKDFFEIVPMIQALDAGYRFRFIDLAPGTPVDKILAAYPAELE